MGLKSQVRKKLFLDDAKLQISSPQKNGFSSYSIRNQQIFQTNTYVMYITNSYNILLNKHCRSGTIFERFRKNTRIFKLLF